MKNLVLGMNDWIKKQVNEAHVPNWKLETSIPAGMSLLALISKLQDLSDAGVKLVKFREEPTGQMTVWSQQHSDIDDTDFDQLPFPGGDEFGTEDQLDQEPERVSGPDQGPEDAEYQG